MAERLDRLTFRVRHLPAYLKRPRVADFLVGTVERIGLLENIHVLSLAAAVDDWSKPPPQTATVEFDIIPACFEDHASKGEWEIPLPGQQQHSILIFDTHFLDFTPLNDVDSAIHKFDCISISGLASHPFGSWRTRNKTSQFMWLRDQLPRDLPGVRTIIYGYDTKLIDSQSFQNIDDLALSLITKLRSIGRTELSAKPVIFLAHSLGGIVLKRSLLYLANSSETGEFMLSRVHGIMFFGVPNKGMEMSHLLPLVRGQPNEQLVQALSYSSGYLAKLDEHFSGVAMFRGVRLVSAYETELSRIFEEAASGRWTRTGPYKLLVERTSAIQAGSKIPDDVFPINRDHSNMVKFSQSDANFTTVLSFLREITERPVASQHFRYFKSSIPKAFQGALKSIWSNAVTTTGFSNLTLDESPNRQRNSQESYGGNPRAAQLSEKEKDRVLDQAIQGSIQLLNQRFALTWLTQEEIRDSLSFQEQGFRSSEIENAYEETFDWIFEDSSLGFVPWLRDEDNLYWIRGKPGSGKSTLMKFLLRDPRCRQILGQWRPKRTQVNVWFFFHERGSHLQKSFEGLLRSLLRDILGQERRFFALINAVYLETEPKMDRWDLKDLETAFNAVRTQRSFDVDIVLFLDALDEHNGYPEVIAEFLKGITSSVGASSNGGTRIKVCFSSREWDVFVENFDPCAGFKIHDQTQDSIRRYTIDRLSGMQHLKQAQGRPTRAVDTLNEQGQSLVNSIVARAEGVFLWVNLVLDRLVEGGPQTSASALEQLLAELPDKLEDLYERTINRIPKPSRIYAFLVLEIIYRSPVILSLRQLVLSCNCALLANISDCQKVVRAAEISGRSEKQHTLLLKNLCGGLVEVIGYPGAKRVQFIHRTVKDFVGLEGFELRMLGKYHAPLEENGYSFLMKYHLANLINGDWDPHNLDKALYFAHFAEASVGKHFGAFLDTVPESLLSDSDASQAKFHPGLFIGCNSMLAFAVLADLRLFVQAKLDTWKRWDVINSNPVKPVLHCAVWFTYAKTRDANFPPVACREMLKLLIANGAQTSAMYENQTAFQALFNPCFEGLRTKNWSPINSAMLDIAKGFLEAGQDPNVELRPYTTSIPFTTSETEQIICRPLHVAHTEMTKILLEHRADVNCLDSNGFTPLDVSLISVSRDGEFSPVDVSLFSVSREVDYVSTGGFLPLDISYETTSLLLEHGGCITNHGAAALKRFLEIMAVRFPLLPDAFSRPPMLGQDHANLHQS